MRKTRGKAFKDGRYKVREHYQFIRKQSRLTTWIKKVLGITYLEQTVVDQEGEINQLKHENKILNGRINGMQSSLDSALNKIRKS